MTELTQLTLPHGPLMLPVFLPDATQGVVRSVDAGDLARCGVEALQANVFHLMLRPGSTTVRALGGLHKMLGWTGPLVTDSGGFQAYSLIRQDPRRGSIADRGLLLHPEGSTRRVLLTPEKSIQLQVSYGADIVICLDDCTHPDDSHSTQEESVRRTVSWARRCKTEFERLMSQPAKRARRPLLLAVIQGGASLSLRRRCAEALFEMAFDGYGFGGVPIAEGGALLEMVEFVRDLAPRSLPLHALGVGHPTHVVRCIRLGYDLIDSVLPTRDARQGRLYSGDALRDGGFSCVYVRDVKHIKAPGPISVSCGCLCCTNYSLGYLHHLHAIGDALYLRLATMHNLRYMTTLVRDLRHQGRSGTSSALHEE